MQEQTKHDLRKACAGFPILGDFVSAVPYGSGHINDTYAVTFSQGGTPIRYIFQRINHDIFKDVKGLMENIHRVTIHAAKKLAANGNGDASRHVLTIIPAHDGKPFFKDENGDFWRVYIFIEKACTYNKIETTKQAFEASKAFGAFAGLVADLGGKRLHETIPNFHHTRSRFETLKIAISEDAAGRKKEIAAEIDFALAREAETDHILDLMKSGAVPERVTHNDTKLNNVMLDAASDNAICVIDLDTVMPGSALYDFGDLVRTSTSPAVEDEKDLSKVAVQMPMFEALVKGYLAGANGFLTQAERDNLAFAGKLITFECGIRFLTDYLQGDVYFKTNHADQNLDRTRTQFKLVQNIEEHLDEMSRIVAEQS